MRDTREALRFLAGYRSGEPPSCKAMYVIPALRIGLRALAGWLPIAPEEWSQSSGRRAPSVQARTLRLRAANKPASPVPTKTAVAGSGVGVVGAVSMVRVDDPSNRSD